MARKFVVSWSDPAFPKVVDARMMGAEGKTLAECKLEIRQHADYELSHWRNVKSRLTCLIAADVEEPMEHINDGTSGQNRESYDDDQDRESYT